MVENDFDRRVMASIEEARRDERARVAALSAELEAVKKERDTWRERASINIDPRHFNILADAMAEVKATSDGLSNQPIADIVQGCIDEIATLSPAAPGVTVTDEAWKAHKLLIWAADAFAAHAKTADHPEEVDGFLGSEAMYREAASALEATLSSDKGEEWVPDARTVERAAEIAEAYCWNRYREGGALKTPAVFNSHTKDDLGAAIRAMTPSQHP